MSYCRFSSEDWTCDLYCYEHCDGGFSTHVAGNRMVGVPKVDYNLSKDATEEEIENFSKAYQAQIDYIKTAERISIDLPHAGQSFNDKTLEEFRHRVLTLKELGYNVPDYVVESINEEISERDKCET